MKKPRNPQGQKRDIHGFDGAGHLDPAHAQRLLALGREDRAADDAQAFVPKPESDDDFVEELAVFRRAKDILPVITPEGHMVEPARLVQAKWPGHAFPCCNETTCSQTCRKRRPSAAPYRAGSVEKCKYAS